ncbi:hypothetical protein ASL14_10415 [Paenibacillus sp. IHB B 3084]|uniref:hypothetical protein n=1 Tax=Paenibacillus sp. IHB B 3084 TaxID=867076 RepID=UPI000722BA24|nr:hypothetical protein [Paenibacillus sp. IHB B 3084]ALP36511.1 hypothetical protein ASL14_10415 [Paenibacillus sp. IHB B 3084]
MNKRLRTVVIILSLIVVVEGAVAVIKSQTFANSSKLQTQTTNDPDWLTPEKKKEINEKVLSSQAEIIHSKYGDFFPVEVPNEYPSDQVANRDNQEQITAQTKQVIKNNFFYEKKRKKTNFFRNACKNERSFLCAMHGA